MPWTSSTTGQGLRINGGTVKGAGFEGNAEFSLGENELNFLQFLRIARYERFKLV